MESVADHGHATAGTDRFAPPPPPPSQDRFLGIRISRLNRRRLENFRRNRRGFWSLWIFLAMFMATLPAEFIANDKPLVVRFDGALYFPGDQANIRRPSSAATSRPRRTTGTRSCGS